MLKLANIYNVIVQKQTYMSLNLLVDAFTEDFLKNVSAQWSQNEVWVICHKELEAEQTLEKHYCDRNSKYFGANC